MVRARDNWKIIQLSTEMKTGPLIMRHKINTTKNIADDADDKVRFFGPLDLLNRPHSKYV